MNLERPLSRKHRLIAYVSIPIRDLMNLELFENGIADIFFRVSIPIRDLMNLEPE